MELPLPLLPLPLLLLLLLLLLLRRPLLLLATVVGLPPPQRAWSLRYRARWNR